MVESWLIRATVPLDAARRSAFRVVARHPGVSTLIVRRNTRVALLACAHTAIAFVLAVFFPVLLLVLGPIVLGVAHVAADVRYLVLRRGLPAGVRHLVWGFCVTLIGLRAVAESHLLPLDLDRAEWAVVTVWTAAFAVIGAAAVKSKARAALGIFSATALGIAALSDPLRARLVFAQGHNVVALVLWLSLFRRHRGSVVYTLFLVALGTVLLGSGKLYGLTMLHGQATAFGVHVLAASDWLAPNLRADHAVGLTCAFAFLQSVHYAVWLLYVPQDDQRFEATRSFRASFRALLRDFGSPWALVIALAGASVLALGFVDAVRTRHLYLSLAMFHGYLELAFLFYFGVRGSMLQSASR